MKSTKKQIIVVFAILTMALVLSCALVACDKSSQKQELSASEIYSSVDSSVVFILISTRSGYSSGSGFFIDNNGTVVTNYHVIEDGLSGVIQKNDGKTATIDKVLGFDKKLDIAILATSATNTKPVAISKTPVQVGDTVYAIGYPEAFKLGFSSSTFTTGIVSMNRSIDGYSYIQSTVNITHGNSGGTLINKNGEVIGITTAGITYSDIDYMNLSIPIQRIDTVSRNVNVPLDVVTKRNYPVYATFYSDGTKYTSQSVRYEGYVYEPIAPTKTGYSFAGWYADSSFNTKFNFNTKLTSNVSIYAKWIINTYNINYNLNFGTWNGSSPFKTYTINDCEKTLPSPVRTGYIFEGWKNASGDYISKLPTSSYLDDLSLTASWVEGTEGLTFITRHSGTAYVFVTGYIGNSANVVIPTTYRGVPVECINASAFKNQTQLISISLPDSLTSIGDYAFYGCTGLTSVTIGSGVTSIGSSAFASCSSLESITIPFVGAKAGVTSSNTYQYPFGYIFGTSRYNGGVATEQYYYGSSTSSTTSTTYYIPSSLKSVTVTGGNILYGAFYNCTGLTSVTIGKGVTSIGDSAFRDCGLTSITIPDSVTSIGGSAFSSCSSLESITIPFVGAKAGVTSSNAYQYPFGYIFGTSSYDGGVATTQYYYGISTSSTTSTTYYIPSSLKSVTVTGGNILYGAFYGCTGLTSVTIGKGVTSIGDSAFRDCGLTSITIPDSVTSIGGSAFDNTLWYNNQPDGLVYAGKVAYKYKGTMPSNTSIVLKEGTLGIADGAFYGCTGLTSITIPDSVTSIGYSAFAICYGLTSVTIPDSVTSIGNNAFYNCTGLSSVTIGNSVASIGEDAFYNTAWYNNQPDGLVYAGKVAYKYKGTMPSNTSIVLREGALGIADAAFYDTGLTSVTIPDSVTSIGYSAFRDCTGLTSIKFNGKIEQWKAISKGGFWKYDVPSACKVICTDGTISI